MSVAIEAQNVAAATAEAIIDPPVEEEPTELDNFLHPNPEAEEAGGTFALAFADDLGYHSDSYLTDRGNETETVSGSEANTTLTALIHPTEFSPLRFLTRCAINLVLPFINGIMVGCGEILAHEIGFRYRWRGARVEPPSRLLERHGEFRKEASRFL